MIENSPKVIYSEIPDSHTYEDVWNLQKYLHQKVIKKKKEGITDVPGYLLLCEHKPVITIGKSGKLENLSASNEDLAVEEIEFFKINRGGDITFHGPGQITGYPILDLDQFYNDVHRYVRELEEVIIRSISFYGLEGKRVEGYTGVWIIDQYGRRKIAAIGVHMSRWVSMHGFALNVSTDLKYFKKIIPCGIQQDDTSVTSISAELKKQISSDEVRAIIKSKFSEVFGFDYITQALNHN